MGQPKKKTTKKEDDGPKRLTQVQIEQTKSQKKRMGHNVIIKKQMVEDEVKRWKFLSSHKDLIKPFVNEKVLARLNIKADLDSIDNKENQIRDIVSVQPESIDPETTTMRDYQMIGLNWMMNMHEKGLGMILGDEMGLVRHMHSIHYFDFCMVNVTCDFLF